MLATVAVGKVELKEAVVEVLVEETAAAGWRRQQKGLHSERGRYPSRCVLAGSRGVVVLRGAG